MTRIGSREFALVLAALALAAAPEAHAMKLAGYNCNDHVQIGNGGLAGLIDTIKIEKEITPAAQECAKACSETKGCVGINVKELWENGKEVTYCQLYSKVAGVTPYPIGSEGKASWGFACVNISRVKWNLPKNETYSAQPQLPGIDPRGYQDTNRPGDHTPGGKR